MVQLSADTDVRRGVPLAEDIICHDAIPQLCNICILPATSEQYLGEAGGRRRRDFDCDAQDEDEDGELDGINGFVARKRATESAVR